MSVGGWRDIGGLIVQLVAKEPPYVQIALGLGTAFIILMILEGLRASFLPSRAERGHGRIERRISPRPARADFRSTPANIAKLPRNPKRQVNIVKSHSAPRPVIRRRASKQAETRDPKNLPQVASFGD